VDGMVLVNLMGFVHLVDALGGVDMNTPYRVQTLKAFPYPDADGSGHTALNIAAGQHHFNGAMALAYARVRHVIGYDSDYYRMSRQQLVIKALRDNLNPCALLPRISSVITSLGGTFWTDMPKADASKLAGLASKIAGTNVKSYTFTPSNGYAEYLTVDRVNKIRNAVAHGLDGVPAGSGSGGGGGGGVGC
jgi:anionic cell wall polymer biosynthesis LytR-Cps2A-Psr (LCP) family protein